MQLAASQSVYSTGIFVWGDQVWKNIETMAGKSADAYDGLSDEALLRQLRAGDAAIMDYVLDKYKPLVRKRRMPCF